MMAPKKKITIPKPGTRYEGTVSYDSAGLPRRCILEAVMTIDGKALCNRCAREVMGP